MVHARQTPRDLIIRPRDRAFFRGRTNKKYWLGEEPVATSFYNALSASFPLGERFFIEAVKRYANRADSALKAQIAAFVAQEAVHSREHVLFNKLVADAGYDVAEMEARVEARISYVRTRPALVQLAATVALEHFTAILAHAALSDPRHFAKANPEARALWLWHAMEEIEHKAVAFDTLMLASGDLSATRRWVLRSTAMVFATWFFLSTVFANMATIFRADATNTVGTWIRALGFMFGSPGLLRQASLDYLSFYRPGFHPWDRDDRDLINSMELQPAAI